MLLLILSVYDLGHESPDEEIQVYGSEKLWKPKTFKSEENNRKKEGNKIHVRFSEICSDIFQMGLICDLFLYAKIINFGWNGP
jgi:hypothetical protein